jgi:hypothetical protein
LESEDERIGGIREVATLSKSEPLSELRPTREEGLLEQESRLEDKFPKEFNFVPRSYILPQEEAVLLEVSIHIDPGLQQAKTSKFSVHIQTKSLVPRQRHFPSDRCS